MKAMFLAMIVAALVALVIVAACALAEDPLGLERPVEQPRPGGLRGWLSWGAGLALAALNLVSGSRWLFWRKVVTDVVIPAVERAPIDGTHHARNLLKANIKTLAEKAGVETGLNRAVKANT